MRKTIALFIILLSAIATLCAEDSLLSYAALSEDTAEDGSGLHEEGTSAEEEDNNWWHLLRQGKLDLKDPNVEYPRFLKFCVDVYNWGDKAFNSYDPEYVVGTGWRWKVFLRNDNLSDAYNMRINDSGQQLRIHMITDITANVGAYLQYMAVSVGYSLDFSNIIGNKPINRKNVEFAFTCARFSAEAYYTENNGGSYIRHFGDYNDGHIFKEYFSGVQVINYGIDAYYFFNNRKYSQGAAYSFSKYQLKSAGSFILGFTYSNQNISLDFGMLPENLKPYMIGDFRRGRFHYNDYCLMFGYGYNWVFAKNWLFNITAIPAVGITHTLEDSFQGSGNHFGFSAMGKMGVTYNINDVYLGLSGNMKGHMYNSGGYMFMNTNLNLSFSAGVRF